MSPALCAGSSTVQYSLARGPSRTPLSRFSHFLIRIRGTWILLNLSSLPETTHLRHLNPPGKQGNRARLLGPSGLKSHSRPSQPSSSLPPSPASLSTLLAVKPCRALLVSLLDRAHCAVVLAFPPPVPPSTLQHPWTPTGSILHAAISSGARSLPSPRPSNPAPTPHPATLLPVHKLISAPEAGLLVSSRVHNPYLLLHRYPH